VRKKEYEEYKEFEERSQEPGGAGYAKRWERIDCLRMQSTQ